jgi:hypothetical protein
LRTGNFWTEHTLTDVVILSPSSSSEMPQQYVPTTASAPFIQQQYVLKMGPVM